MDVNQPSLLIGEAKGDGIAHKGVFGLSCVSDSFFRPAIQRRNTHIFALNTGLTYPSAYTVAGIVRAVAAGQNHKGIHREAARAFAEGQKKSVGTMRRALSYGDKPIVDKTASNSLDIQCRDQWGAKPATREGRQHVIKRITIHHQGVQFTRQQNAPTRLKSMQKYHQGSSKGFHDIAYHFVVDPNGVVYEGRPYSAIGETETDYNPKGHLLICLMGNFDKQTPTEPAINSLTHLIAWAVRAFDLDIDAIRGHRNHAHTTCPGTNLQKLIDNKSIKEKAEALLSQNNVALKYGCAD